MATLVGFQNVAIWFLLAGVVVIVVALVAYHLVRRVPNGVSIGLIWVGGILLLVGVLAYLGPSIVGIFFAQPV